MKNKKILLVDDANLFLEVAKQILKPTGAQILTARNGIDALKILETEKPDFVILDLMMPDMGGDKICAHIKGHPGFSDIPVIMVTSRGRPEELEKCRQAGCDDFLTKPVKAEVLLEKIANLNKRSKRHSIQVLVRMETVGKKGKEVIFGTSGDLSKTGMSVQADKELELGQTLALRFFVATSRKELIFDGSIVRKESQIGGILYGIQFGGLTLEQKQALGEFIDLKTKR